MNEHPALRSRETACVLLAYLVISLLFTMPLVTRFHSHVFSGGDSMQFLWDFWWIRYSLLELRQGFFFTDYLYYPDGVSLAFHEFSLLNCFVSIPLQSFLGLPAIYNLLVLASYVLGCFGCYWLVLHLTGSHTASFIGGIVYGFSSFHLVHASRLHLGSIQWLPFFGLYFWMFLSEPRLKTALLAALFYVLASLTSWYYMVYLCIWGLVHGLVALPRVLHQGKARALLGGSVAFVMVSMAGIVPFLLPALNEFFAGLRYMTVAEDYSRHFSADLVALFSMNPSHFLVGSWFTPLYSTLITHPTENYVFLGYTATLLAMGAVLSMRKSKAGIWSLGCFLSLLLALGPHLQVLGVEYSSIRLPYYYLAEAPFLNVMRGSTRCMSMVFLFLAVLSGLGFHRLAGWVFRRGHHRWIWVMATACAALVLVEQLPTPFRQLMTPVEIERHPYYGSLRERPDQHAVLDLPLPGILYPNPLVYQTVHLKRIVGGYVARPPESSLRVVDANPVLQYLVRLPSLAGAYLFGFDETGELPSAQVGLEDASPLEPSAPPDVDGVLETLGEYRIGTVVVHKACYRPRYQRVIERLLDRVGLEKSFEDRSLLVYRVGPRD